MAQLMMMMIDDDDDDDDEADDDNNNNNVKRMDGWTLPYHWCGENVGDKEEHQCGGQGS